MSLKRFIRAVLELGQNTVLAAALISFGASANLTPSLLASVSTWSRFGNAAMILGASWALLALGWYGYSVVSALSGRKRAWIFQVLGFALGCFLVMGTIAVVVVWAANNAGMRYCTGKPGAQDLEACAAAFEIPSPEIEKNR